MCLFVTVPSFLFATSKIQYNISFQIIVHYKLFKHLFLLKMGLVVEQGVQNLNVQLYCKIFIQMFILIYQRSRKMLHLSFWSFRKSTGFKLWLGLKCWIASWTFPSTCIPTVQKLLWLVLHLSLPILKIGMEVKWVWTWNAVWCLECLCCSLIHIEIVSRSQTGMWIWKVELFSDLCTTCGAALECSG